MNCRKVRLELTDYLANRLDGPTSAAVGDHLQKCRRCSEEAVFLQNYLDNLDKLAVKEAPADFEAKFRNTLKQSRFNSKVSSRQFVPQKFFVRPVLAGFVAVMTLFLAINYFKVSVPEKPASELSEIKLLQKEAPLRNTADTFKAAGLNGESEIASIPVKPEASDISQNVLTLTLSIAKTRPASVELSKRTFAAKADESEVLSKNEGSMTDNGLFLKLKGIIVLLKGEIISQSAEAGQYRLLEADIPGFKFEELVVKLKDLGQVAFEDEPVSVKDVDRLRIKLRLVQEE